MTIEEITALSDTALDAAIAETLMGWQKYEVDDVNPKFRHIFWIPAGKGFPDSVEELPHFCRDMSAAWQVVERIMRIPESKEEATTAPNTRFLYAFEREGATFICSSEHDAARWICEQALAAWTAGPLFSEESEDN